ncbi:hypothetical protein D3C73_1471260 [compost metagenome]
MKIPIPLAILPVCAFIFIGISQKSIYLVISACILAVGHISISYDNYIKAENEYNKKSKDLD